MFSNVGSQARFGGTQQRRLTLSPPAVDTDCEGPDGTKYGAGNYIAESIHLKAIIIVRADRLIAEQEQGLELCRLGHGSKVRAGGGWGLGWLNFVGRGLGWVVRLWGGVSEVVVFGLGGLGLRATGGLEHCGAVLGFCGGLSEVGCVLLWEGVGGLAGARGCLRGAWVPRRGAAWRSVARARVICFVGLVLAGRSGRGAMFTFARVAA